MVRNCISLFKHLPVHQVSRRRLVPLLGPMVDRFERRSPQSCRWRGRWLVRKLPRLCSYSTPGVMTLHSFAM